MKQLRDSKAQGSALFTLVSGIIIAIAVIYFLIKLAGSGSFADVNQSSEAATQTRIQPAGQLALGDGIPVGERKGDQIFNKICIQCHAADSSVPNAPKIENNGDWAPRIGQGFDTLFQHALNGFNAMPAKGGAADLTDQELKTRHHLHGEQRAAVPSLIRMPQHLPIKPLQAMQPPPHRPLPAPPPQPMHLKPKTKALPLLQPPAQTVKKFSKQPVRHVTAAQSPAFPA